MNPATGHRDARERGSVALIAAALGGSLLLGCGLIVDASTKISAYRQAETTAQEAGRAAAQALSGAAIAGEDGQVDPGRAVQAGQAYLAAVGESGTVTVTGTQVRITTSQPWRGRFFPGGGTAQGSATIDLTASP